MLTTVNYHIHGRLWRHSRDSQALSGPMWNKVSWDTGRVSTYICTKYASQVPEEDAHGNYTHHQSQSQLCCPLNRISACRTGAGFLSGESPRCHSEATKASIVLNHPCPVNIKTWPLFLPVVPQTLRKGWASSSGSCFTQWSCGAFSVQLLLISPLWSHPESCDCTTCSAAAQPAA